MSSSITSDPKKFWTFVNKRRNTPRIPDAVTLNNSCAVGSDRPNFFLEYFTASQAPTSNFSLTDDFSLSPVNSHCLSEIQTDPKEVAKYL